MTPSYDLDAEKRHAALKATEFVRDGMVVGLGTGTTSKHLILALGERVRAGLTIQAVPTSHDTAALARQSGIPLIESDNSWIGLSGRFWIVVYNKNLVKPEQVTSLLDLAKPQWKDKVAIPNSGSEYLQAGVSVIKATFGDDRTKQFLQGLKTNAGTQVYQKSSQIVEAVAKGQAALGIVNHYYIYRHLAAQPAAPIAAIMTDQQEGGMGAIMNVTGIGITRTSKHVESAKLLVEFLVAQAGQKLFADLDKEYPLHPEVKADPALVDRHSFRAALVPLARLAELRESTLTLIEQIGLR